MAILKSLISDGDSVADIGANVGVYTREFSLLVGQGGEFTRASPLSRTIISLKTSLARLDYPMSISSTPQLPRKWANAKW